MIESLPVFVLGCRPDGACDDVSRRWVEYTGVSESEQLGYGRLDQLLQEDRDRVRDAWRRAVKAGTPLDTEFRLRRQDGQYRWFMT